VVDVLIVVVRGPGAVRVAAGVLHPAVATGAAGGLRGTDGWAVGLVLSHQVFPICVRVAELLEQRGCRYTSMSWTWAPIRPQEIPALTAPRHSGLPHHTHERPEYCS